MENKFEFIMPFLILAAIFIPKLFKGLPVEIADELTKLLFASVIISIVIVVLRYLRKIEK
ncbi:MAG: hypothetical protein AABW58_02770 [Nanoarchaeota archaeon]